MAARGPGYVFAALITLPFMLFAVLFYRAQNWRWHDGVLTCLGGMRDDGTSRIWGKPGGQTWGWLTVFKDESQRQRPELRVHERCHTVQTFVLGPLWLVVYGVMFIVPYARNPSAGWKAAYEQILFEVWAYAREALSLTDKPQPSWRWGALPLVV